MKHAGSIARSRKVIVPALLLVAMAWSAAPRAGADVDSFDLDGKPARVVEVLERKIESSDKKLEKQLLKIEQTAEKRFSQRTRRIKEDCVDIPFHGEECLVDEKENLSLEQRMERSLRTFDDGTEKLERGQNREIDKLEEVSLRAVEKLEAGKQPKNADPADYAEARQCVRDVVSAKRIEIEELLLASRERFETRLMELLDEEGAPAF